MWLHPDVWRAEQLTNGTANSRLHTCGPSNTSQSSYLGRTGNCQVHVQVGRLALSSVMWLSGSPASAPRHGQISHPRHGALRLICCRQALWDLWFANGFDKQASFSRRCSDSTCQRYAYVLTRDASTSWTFATWCGEQLQSPSSPLSFPNLRSSQLYHSSPGSFSKRSSSLTVRPSLVDPFAEVSIPSPTGSLRGVANTERVVVVVQAIANFLVKECAKQQLFSRHPHTHLGHHRTDTFHARSVLDQDTPTTVHLCQSLGSGCPGAATSRVGAQHERTRHAGSVWWPGFLDSDYQLSPTQPTVRRSEMAPAVRVKSPPP